MTIIEALVDGGKASAAPPLGPQLGPLGLNISQVINDINEKTKAFKGMQVPVKLDIDDESKEYTISVGTPPTSQLIKKEAKIDKGSGSAKAEKVADVLIEQVIKIAKMKEDSLTGVELKQQVKEVIGTCLSMGILVEGKDAREAIKAVEAGDFDKEIKEEKTELTDNEIKKLDEEKKKMAADLKNRRAELDALAKNIVESMAKKSPSDIKNKLRESGIPETMIKELVIDEKKPKDAAAPAPAKKK